MVRKLPAYMTEILLEKACNETNKQTVNSDYNITLSLWKSLFLKPLKNWIAPSQDSYAVTKTIIQLTVTSSHYYSPVRPGCVLLTGCQTWISPKLVDSFITCVREFQQLFWWNITLLNKSEKIKCHSKCVKTKTLCLT
jgi:hypothetical protein